jgi:hypothetical protein
MHASEKHYVVHREGMELDDAWRQVSFMLHIEHWYEKIQCSVSRLLRDETSKNYLISQHMMFCHLDHETK